MPIIDKNTVKQVITNHEDISYPVLVNGAEFGNDSAMAWGVVLKLIDKVEALERTIKIMNTKEFKWEDVR